MIEVVIARDIAEPASWTKHECEDLREFLKSEFEVWPATARIYHQYVAQNCDVTPSNEAEVERLGTLEGNFIVVVYPGAWVLILAVVALIALTAAIFFLTPKPPSLTNQDGSQSANNQLSDRQNESRVNGRIPDIFGTVRSTPDLIQVPYNIYVDGVQNEICYMCVGRGSYTTTDWREDQTLINVIDGESIQVFGPFTSPNSGDAPELLIGDAFSEPVRNVKRANGVNGQTLYAPNYDSNPTSLRWTTPVIIAVDSIGALVTNFYAGEGLYLVQGDGDQFDVTVDLQIGVTAVDADGTPHGVEALYTVSMTGDAIKKNSLGCTLSVPITNTTGFISVRAVRTSNTNKDSKQQQVDTTQWQDLYVMSNYLPNDFGDVTTVQTRTLPTTTALAVENRKLNCQASRNIPTRISGTTFTTDLFPTSSADEIIAFVSLDPYIGRRTIAELDLDNIYGTVATIKVLFGSDACGGFNYTFDDVNMSFEETLATIATAIFSYAYRYGSQIRLFFEQETDDSSLLFNHRNIVPQSESRASMFGTQNNYDGIQYDFADPTNYDQVKSIFLPSDRSAKNAQQIQSVGVRDPLQAYFQLNRAYNKLQYQNTSTDFSATQQSELTINGMRVLCSDTTRNDVQDGQIVSQTVLNVSLSQTCVFKSGVSYVISVQHDDTTVEIIAVTPVGSPDSHGNITSNVVTLATAPRRALAIGEELYRPAAFKISGSTDKDLSAFLVTTKAPDDGLTLHITAINYDSRYYGNDLDFIDGVVDASGNPTGDDPVHHKGSMLDRYMLLVSG